MGQSNTHYLYDNLPTGEHSVLPVDGHSYQPKSLEYSLLITESTADTELIIRQRDNLQAIYPLVAKFYNDGYTLNQLKRIPCVKFDNKTLFQVILSRPVGTLRPNANEKWQLHVKRSFVSTEHSNSTITTHVTELWRDIQEEACRGARLVSIEPTIPAAHHQVQEVDVFFNLRPHPSPSFYIYQAISVPVVWQRDSQHGSEHALECNWFTNFTTFLSEGWKLVEILFDSSVRHRVTVPSRTLTMNSVWVFEKEAQFENISSPKWEGVIVGYLHKSSTRSEDFKECYAKTSWNKIIHTMGSRGWEIACIVSTPPSIQKASLITSIHCKVLMFFQRPFTGNKPLHRQTSSTSQSLSPISPIRFEGFPEWSIIGESHMEEGRPVCLPPYSERGVDVGPLESTPEPQNASQVPPEPPPTYAEAVASEVTILFNTSMPETTPPLSLSPTQRNIPLQMSSSAVSLSHAPSNWSPPGQSGQMPSSNVENNNVFFNNATNNTGATPVPPSSYTLQATPVPRNATQPRRGPPPRPTSGPPPRPTSGPPTRPTTGPDRGAVASTNTQSVPPSATPQPTRSSTHPENTSKTRVPGPSDPKNVQHQQRPQPQQRSRSQKNQQPHQTSQSQQRSQQQKPVLPPKMSSTAKGKAPPKPPRAPQNVQRKEGNLSASSQTQPSKGNSEGRRGNKRPKQKPVTQVPTVMVAGSAKSKKTSLEHNEVVPESQVSNQHAPPARPLNTTDRDEGPKEDRQEERSYQRKPAVLTTKEPNSAPAISSHKERTPKVKHDSQAHNVHVTTTIPPSGSDHSDTTNSRQSGEFEHRRPVAKAARRAGLSSTAYTQREEIKPRNVHKSQTEVHVPQNLPNDIVIGESSNGEKRRPELPHHRKPTQDDVHQVDPYSKPAESSAMQASKSSNVQAPVPLPRNIEGVGHGNTEEGRVKGKTSAASRMSSDHTNTTMQYAQGKAPKPLPRKSVPPATQYSIGGSQLKQDRVYQQQNSDSHISKPAGIQVVASTPHFREDKNKGRSRSSDRERSAMQPLGKKLEPLQHDQSQVDPEKRERSPTHQEWNDAHFQSLHMLRKKKTEIQSQTSYQERNMKTRARNQTRPASTGQHAREMSGSNLSAAERLHVISVKGHEAERHQKDHRHIKKDDSYQEPKMRYGGQTQKKDVAFDPSLVQKRRDRDYVRIPGRTKENADQGLRSKDDLTFNHSRVEQSKDVGRVQVALAEITNTGPKESDASDVPPPIPPRRKRSNQGLAVNEKAKIADEKKHMDEDFKKQIQAASVKTLKIMDENSEQTIKSIPVKRPLPSYNQVIEQRTHSKHDSLPNHGDSVSRYKPSRSVDESQLQELPDLVQRHKEKKVDNFWLINDVGNDEVFISSQLRPESQQRTNSPRSDRHKVSVNQSRPAGYPDQDLSGKMPSPRIPEKGNTTREETHSGFQIDLSAADRRSLDSLQSFIVDQTKKPPEYDTVLTKRVVKPRPVKERRPTAPDLIEAPGRSSGHHDQHKDQLSQQRPHLDIDGGMGKSVKPPPPSYQQVVNARSGAIPKLKVTEHPQFSDDFSSQSSSESDRHRREGGNRGQRSHERGNAWETENLQKGQERGPALEEYATPVAGSLYPWDMPPSRRSESPAGSMDSFDLISQWSQDEVEPPSSRLTKELRPRREQGQPSSGEYSDRECGDYSLTNNQGNPQDSRSADLSGHFGTSGGTQWRTSTWSPKVSRKDFDRGRGSGTADRSATQEWYNPGSFQKLTQRPLYVSKEIL